MQRWCVIAALAASPWAGAASALDFDVWMRAIDKRSVTVQKSIAAQDVEAAKADARELERYYALMETYFVKDGPAQDAARQSAEGRALASAIHAALDQQDYATAAQSALTLARSCNDCHDNHKPFK
ncbi:MAG TPA: hypothetical protein VHQ87_08010 [Rhizobacter sp.]|nr:hypothetical protein [Rhizobacter sp.]